MTYSNFVSPGVSLQGGGGSGSGTASLPISGNGATVTASTPLINGTQTWNSGATTFTSLLLNVTDTASAAASLLMDLQVGGSSKFKVDKAGTVTVGNQVVLGSSSAVNTTFSNNSMAMLGSGAGFQVYNGAFIGFSSTGTSVGTADVLLTRRGAANLRLGAADAAAPVAQTLSVQSVVAGTSNTAGANLTITGSQGTGTGAGGSIIFQVAPAGSSGTAQNALATALTINADRTLLINSAGTSVSPSLYWNTNPGVLSNWGFYSPASGVTSFTTANAEIVRFGGPLNGLVVYEAIGFGPTLSAPDVRLFRDAANTLALRNGANAQVFNVYNTFTDASNYERGKIAWSSNVLQIGTEKAGTGTARALEFQTDGTTRLTISTAGNATVTGWIKSNAYFDAPAAALNGNGGIYFGVTATGVQIQATAVGVLAIANYAGSDFNRLQFGGTTSSFPALKRSSASLQARLADDSDYTTMDAQHRLQGTAPASAAATGTAGDIRYDADYIYICTATNTWKRVAIATWP